MDITTEQLLRWLPAVGEIAEAAGREIMRIYAAGFNVTLKDDRSPLTDADLAAQRTIAAGLTRLTPDIPMLAEESPPSVFAERQRWPVLWLVDPLDGTREFVKRNGEFTVNIALVQQDRPVLGIVSAPARGVSYWAVRGGGAQRRNADGSSAALHVCAQAPARLRVLASRSHGDAVLDRALATLGPQERLSVGSALKFGLVAEGAADLYVRRGPTSEWDTAAGHAVLLEAGGGVIDLQGAPLRYNQRATLVNPPFIAYGDGGRHWAEELAVLRPDRPS